MILIDRMHNWHKNTSSKDVLEWFDTHWLKANRRLKVDGMVHNPT